MGPSIEFSRDGHYLGGHGIALLVKNPRAAPDATYEDGVAGYFSQALTRGAKDLEGGLDC
jgi:hypothetical protein